MSIGEEMVVGVTIGCLLGSAAGLWLAFKFIDWMELREERKSKGGRG